MREPVTMIWSCGACALAESIGAVEPRAAAIDTDSNDGLAATHFFDTLPPKDRYRPILIVVLKVEANRLSFETPEMSPRRLLELAHTFIGSCSAY